VHPNLYGIVHKANLVKLSGDARATQEAPPTLNTIPEDKPPEEEKKADEDFLAEDPELSIVGDN
jgi:hypothetical protein